MVASCASTSPTGTSPPSARVPHAAPLLPPGGATEAQPSPIGRMARIPEATYQMGSDVGEPDERPAHVVHVASFELDLTEVTVALYAECARAGACKPATREIQFPGVTATDRDLYDSECNDDRSGRQDHPVNCVDWSMADAYCRWAGKRLPTEEEWEYAACGGSCDEALHDGGGVRSILGAERWPFTTRVATAWPGHFGLYDMAGNVWEWTSTTYCPYDHPGCGDARRVIRGGSWSLVDYLFVRLTDRSPADPSNRVTNVGFRCARSVP
jgi:formylglycine-generating enzyme required for sulfatase activity